MPMSKKSKLMIFKTPMDVWQLILWVPFYGQWILTRHVKKSVFDRKSKQIIDSIGLPVEEVGKLPASKI